MTRWKHWQDAANTLLGLWLVLCPWILDLQQPRVAAGALVFAGVLLLVAGVTAILEPQAWEEWFEAGVGVALVASPWVLGYAGATQAVQVAVITGLVVTVLALWVLAVDKDYGAWWTRLLG